MGDDVGEGTDLLEEEGKACKAGPAEDETPPLGVPDSGSTPGAKKPGPPFGNKKPGPPPPAGKKPMMPTDAKKPETPMAGKKPAPAGKKPPLPPIPEPELKTASLLGDIASLEKKLQESVGQTGEDITSRPEINAALDAVRKALEKEASSRGLQAEQWKDNEVAAPRDLSAGKGLPTEFPGKGSDADIAGSSVSDTRKLPTYAEGQEKTTKAPDTGKDYMKIIELALRQAKELQSDQKNAAFGKSLEAAAQQTVAAQTEMLSKTIERAMKPFHQEFTDLAAKLDDVQKRLNSVEKTSQPSQSGPDATLNEGDEIVEKTQQTGGGFWGGIIRKSAQSALAQYPAPRK